MKKIEMRRHSIRVKPSPHLTQQGVEKARKVGDSLGSFNYVISSNVPRAIETAVAMGYAVDKVMEEVSMTPSEIDDEISWGMDFAQYNQVITEGGKTAQYADQMAMFIKEISKIISDNETLLIISHGGLIELTAIGCFPLEEYKKWGEALDTCEGVRIYLDNEEFKRIELLRVKMS